jgi:hypothetical protein
MGWEATSAEGADRSGIVRGSVHEEDVGDHPRDAVTPRHPGDCVLTRQVGEPSPGAAGRATAAVQGAAQLRWQLTDTSIVLNVDVTRVTPSTTLTVEMDDTGIPRRSPAAAGEGEPREREQESAERVLGGDAIRIRTSAPAPAAPISGWSSPSRIEFSAWERPLSRRAPGGGARPGGERRRGESRLFHGCRVGLNLTSLQRWPSSGNSPRTCGLTTSTVQRAADRARSASARP